MAKPIWFTDDELKVLYRRGFNYEFMEELDAIIAHEAAAKVMTFVDEVVKDRGGDEWVYGRHI